MNRFSSCAAVGLVALLALAGRGHAQDAADAGQGAVPQNAPPQRYQIEIILFANTDADPHAELFSIEHPAAAPATTPLPLQPLPYGQDADTELQSVPGAAPPIAAEQAAGGAIGAGAGQAPAPSAGPGTATPQQGGASPGTAAPSAAELQAVPDVPQDEASTGNGTATGGAGSGDQAAAGAATNAPAPVQAFTFRLVKPDQMKLNAEYAKLGRLDAYRPLGHAAWIQEGLPENQARPIDMAELGIANPSGTIQLHVSRYLHVSINLTYRTSPQTDDTAADGGTQADAGTPDGAAAAPPTASPVPGQSAQEQADGNAAELGTITVAHRYIMHQERRVRAGELQYFDHPMFGLLLLITPAPKQAPANGNGTGSGALRPAA